MPQSTPQTLDQLTGLGTRQAITTLETDGRIVASCDAGQLTVCWHDALDMAGNHAAAALALLHRLGWHERNHLVGGSIGQDRYVFVQVPPPAERGGP